MKNTPHTHNMNLFSFHSICVERKQRNLIQPRLFSSLGAPSPPPIICPFSRDAIRQVWLLPRRIHLDTWLGSVARKPQGLCAPHVAQINLLGRFPGGTQSLTAETLLSLSSSRLQQRERERGARRERATGEERREVVKLGLGVVRD